MNLQRTIYSLLTRIEESILLIQGQTKHIKCADDFMLTPEGTFTLYLGTISWDCVILLRTNIIA